MKLSQIIEARYVGPTNAFVVTWPNLDWSADYRIDEPGMWYTFGETAAPFGLYVREEQVVAVAGTKKQALDKVKKGVGEHEVAEYGAPLEYKEKHVVSRFLEEISESLTIDGEWQRYPFAY